MDVILVVILHKENRLILTLSKETKYSIVYSYISIPQF